jgi:Ca2+-binding EF-hand superfamily protein
MASTGVYAHLGSEADMLHAAGQDFAGANASGSGELTLDEFLPFYAHLEAHMRALAERRGRATAAFHHFDTDKNGTIDRHEFRAALCALGVVRALSADASTAHIDAHFARLDTDGSGALCAEEFVRFYLDAEEKAAADAARDGAALAKFAELAQGAPYIEKDKFWHALLGLGLFHGLTVEQAVDKARWKGGGEGKGARRGRGAWEGGRARRGACVRAR